MKSKRYFVSVETGTIGVGSAIYATTPIRTMDYYPFGLEMNKPDTDFGEFAGYRFGFNGKEADSDSEWGSATHYDYGFRIYNPSIGKFLSVDPLSPDYPWYTPYQFAGNMPIWAIDLDGLEPKPTNDGNFEGQQQSTSATYREEGLVETLWVYHEGSDALGTEAGWYNQASYQRQVVQAIGTKHGRNDGQGANPNIPSSLIGDFDLSSYLNFSTFQDYESWVANNGDVYNQAYSEQFAISINSGQGRLDPVYPIFDILSFGSAKFWANAAKLGLTALPRFGRNQLAGGSVKFTVATMNKGTANAGFGHTVIGIGDNFYHQVIVDGKPVLKLFSGDAKLVRYGGDLGENYTLQTFMIPYENAAAAHNLVNNTLGRAQKYSLIPGCGQNCATNGINILNAAGVPIPKSVLTPNQLNNYISSLKRSGYLFD